MKGSFLLTPETIFAILIPPMQNDDLGQFPTPQSSTPPVFEPTPDNLNEENKFDTNSTPITEPKEDSPVFTTPKSEPLTPPTPQPIPATLPTNLNSSNPSSLLSVVLLIVAGVGISGSVFLYSQSAALKRQLTDITQTLERQKTVVTPTPTPSIIEIPTPSATPTMEDELTPTPTASPTAMVSKTIMPLALATQALKVGINHEPNAQLILIKAENAHDQKNSLIKYFFRKDLTTKKYFYVSVNSSNESEIVDKSIYVNPDNNIPSLNDLVLGNKLGIDYDEAMDIVKKTCTSKLCDGAAVKAQYIKSGTKTIWQLTLTPTSGSQTLLIQIDTTTKEVLYKSSGFTNL